MKRIIYTSRAHRDFDPGELPEIARNSAMNNALDSLTGMLIFVNDAFLQVLEGPSAAVDKTFERISGDWRHRQIVRRAEGPIAERRFPNWAMGCHTLMPGDLPKNIIATPNPESVFQQLVSAQDIELSTFLEDFYDSNVAKKPTPAPKRFFKLW